MSTLATFAACALVIGAGATALLDLWNLARQRLRGASRRWTTRWSAAGSRIWRAGGCVPRRSRPRRRCAASARSAGSRIT